MRTALFALLLSAWGWLVYRLVAAVGRIEKY